MINGCSRPVCVDLYHLAPKGATNCESGNPITVKYCDKAVAILARRNNKTPGELQTGSGGKCGDGGWGSVPRGCSAQTGGDWAAHLKLRDQLQQRWLSIGVHWSRQTGHQTTSALPKIYCQCKRGQKKSRKIENGC